MWPSGRHTALGSHTAGPLASHLRGFFVTDTRWRPAYKEASRRGSVDFWTRFGQHLVVAHRISKTMSLDHAAGPMEPLTQLLDGWFLHVTGWGTSLRRAGCCSPILLAQDEHVLAKARPRTSCTHSPTTCAQDCSHLLLIVTICGQVFPRIAKAAAAHKRVHH